MHCEWNGEGYSRDSGGEVDAVRFKGKGKSEGEWKGCFNPFSRECPYPKGKWDRHDRKGLGFGEHATVVER
jgi:hypothetical protein